MDNAGIGMILALFSGLGFGLGTIMVRASSSRLSPLLNMYVSLLVGTPLLLAAVIIKGGLRSLECYGWLLYSLTGVLHYLIGRLLLFYSVEKIGAASASISASPSIVLASLLAWLLLDEPIGPRMAASVVLISLAVYLAGTRPSGLGYDHREKILGVTAGLGASIVFAATTLIIRYTGQGYGSETAGAFASYLAALLMASPFMARRRMLGELRKIDKYLGFAVAAGLMVSLAQLLRYNALGMAPVALVVVFISMNSVYAAVFSPLVGSAREKPGARHLAAALLAVASLYLAATSR